MRAQFNFQYYNKNIENNAQKAQNIKPPFLIHNKTSITLI